MGFKNPPENKTLASLLSAYTQAVSEDGSCEYPWGNRAGCRQSLNISRKLVGFVDAFGVPVCPV